MDVRDGKADTLEINNHQTAEEQLPAQQEAEIPTVDIMINNVVCSFSVRCHLNLHEIALSGSNVEYKREHGMLTMKIRKPCTSASIWSSGKITCTGATSEDTAKLAARKFCRILQKMGHNVRFANYRVVNVLGTCSMPFGIKLQGFAERYPRIASYEPELHPGITFRIDDLHATLKIFSTGSITITAPSVSKVQSAVERVFPLVLEFQKPKAPRAQRPEIDRLLWKEIRGNRIRADPLYDFDYDYDSEEELNGGSDNERWQ